MGVTGKGRRAMEQVAKVGKKQPGVFIGSRRAGTMAAARLMVQSVTFSSAASSGAVLLVTMMMMMMTTTTAVAIAAPFQ